MPVALLRGVVRASAGTWARAAVAGVVIYVALDVLLVFLRPHFSVLHNAESDYGSKGRWAWVMDANFLLRGAFSLAVVRALRLLPRASARTRPGRWRIGRWGIGLWGIGIWAVASALLAFFPDDPVGTTIHGLAKVHQLLAVIAFPAIVVGTRFESRALRRASEWRPVASALTVISWGALVPVILLGKAHLRPHSLGGLYEKLFLAVELAWLLLAALWVARLETASSRAGAPAPQGLPPGPSGLGR